MASAAGNDQVEELLAELGRGNGNAFKTFIQRAQLVITGLMHISILLLPRYNEESADSQPVSKPGQPSKSTPSTSSSAANSNKSSKTANVPAAGFPADGSDFRSWKYVNDALRKTISSGLDWTNCCIYNLRLTGDNHDDNATASLEVQPSPSYPVSATAGYHIAKIQSEAIVCNDYGKGPHFADWRELHAAGARSIASAPMFSSDNRLIGILNLASTHPNAFEQSRVVWILAMALAPAAAVLKYTTQALQIDHFIRGIMPTLLEQNYLRNISGKKLSKSTAAAGNTGAQQKERQKQQQAAPDTTTTLKNSIPSTAGKLTGVHGSSSSTCTAATESSSLSSTSSSLDDLLSGKNRDHDDSPGSPGTCDSASSVSESRTGSGKKDLQHQKRDKAAAEAHASLVASKLAVSGQFAEHAEVLITTSGGGNKVNEGGVGDAMVTVASGAASAGGGVQKRKGKAAATRMQQNSAVNQHKDAASDHFDNSNASALHNTTLNGTTAPNNTSNTNTTATATGVVLPNNITRSPSPISTAPSTTPSSTPPTEADLDWGDFMFNLVSMCIVYAYFSEAAVAGESQTAVIASMCIAAIDIALLALRWLWYERYITHGGAVLQVFQAYRVVVLPIANTWMLWSLLNKLGVQPGRFTVAGLGAAIVVLLIMGLQTRSLLHAPLQLASVVFSAATTTNLCTSLFGGTMGLKCMGTMSVVQLSIGVVIPSVLVQVLEMRSAGDKPYLPHVQAKRGLLHG